MRPRIGGGSSARVSETKRPYEYWRDLNRWLAEEGLAIVRRWADEFLKDNRAVEDGEEAPATERKREVVRAGWTDDERLAHEIAEVALACGEDIVLRLDEVRADVGRALGKDLQRTEPEDQLRKAMVDAGMHEMPIGKDGRRERMKIGKGVNKHGRGDLRPYLFDVGASLAVSSAPERLHRHIGIYRGATGAT